MTAGSNSTRWPKVISKDCFQKFKNASDSHVTFVSQSIHIALQLLDQLRCLGGRYGKVNALYHGVHGCLVHKVKNLLRSEVATPKFGKSAAIVGIDGFEDVGTADVKIREQNFSAQLDSRTQPLPPLD